MRKHVWKLLALLLCLALFAAVFAACGNGDATSAETSATEDGDITSSDGEITTQPGTDDTVGGDTAGGDTSDTATVTSSPTVVPSDPCAEHTPSAGGTYCTACYTILKENGGYEGMVDFVCDDATLTQAYAIALNDCVSNIKYYKGGLLSTSTEVIIAGADYTSPWTRDASINVWNAFALLDREVSKNTLYSVLTKNGGRYYIDGQYWDAVIFAIGAYQYYLVSGDVEFLKIAQAATANSLAKYEKEEFDETDNLFRGGAVYADGIAAYPDQYATNIGTPGIESWLDRHQDQKVNEGVGLPMKALSTNCVYYQAYVLLAQMTEALGKDASDYETKAEAMKKAINKAFWNEEKGTYDYFAYECDYQEAIGVAFVLMFGIADERQTALVLENTYVTDQGIACVWPAFDRYLELGGYGRHAGTIWPHAQGFWGQACAMYGYYYGYETELFTMAERAVRDNQFYEIYHPDTGAVYGGLQGTGMNDIFLWGSASHQTWSATAYLSLIYYHMLGATVSEGSVTFTPYLPTGVNEVTINDFKVGNTTFDVVIVRGGEGPTTATYETTAEGTVQVILSVK